MEGNFVYVKEKKKKKAVPILLVLLMVCSSFSALSTTASNSTNVLTGDVDININIIENPQSPTFKNSKLESVIARLANAHESNLVEAYPMGTITSEGVGVINADRLHAEGIKGDAVKIAVIDEGFKGYDSNPKIPSENIAKVKSFRADGALNISEHGTACAEVVLDVAPKAKLYLFNFGTAVEFANAVDYAISQGVNIILCPMGFCNAGGYDGTGVVCDAVDNARDNGILFVVAAGDEARRHYEGKYVDTDEDAWHEFSSDPDPIDEILDITVGRIPDGTEIGFCLSWDDWPISCQDYDLYLYEAVWNEVTEEWDWTQIDSSTNPQTGTQPPTEGIEHVKTANSERWGILIHRYSASKEVNFELYCTCGDISFLEHNVESSSLAIPADAEGAMAVGATYWKNDNLEAFSSRGPTNDNRIKPDVTAPDGTSNSVYGKFEGTSASASHAAGAAALLLSAKPSLTADEMQSLLESTAVDLGVTGKDNSYGSGRIDVWKAYQQMGPQPVTIVNITPPTQTVSTKSSFTVDITVDPAVPIAGVQFDLSFNPSLVNATSVTEGELLKQGGAQTYFNPGAIDNKNGTITGVAGTITTSGETVSSEGVFATIEMTALDVSEAATSPLDLPTVIVADMHGKPVSLRVNDGCVIVVIEPWDVNRDGSVNVLDMILVGQHFGETGPEGWIPEDINRDGNINVLDMILIGQHWTG